MILVSSTNTAFEVPYRSFESVFDTMIYPAGEAHVRLHNNTELPAITTIEANIRSFEELAQIVVADRIARRNGHQLRWVIPYFPFARHDRRNDDRDGFELELAIELARQLDVIVADPHSEVTAQLPHFPQASVVDCFIQAGLFDDDPLVVIPDAGAAKKAYSWLAGRDYVQALKQRDPQTGALSGFDVLTDDLGGRPCIIIDDICDGGGTFLGLAEVLKERGAGPLTLAVTHGLFTKGTEALRKAFSTLACLAPSDSESCLDGVLTIPFSDLYMKGSVI